ncbi:MAG: peptidoglycan DD-metalloendopeptidase family protein [Muribaculaceae bacterium]|nr:peptidoglycan DD-metalloendopeptidase family protein [Muribaculaceae bacterium]
MRRLILILIAALAFASAIPTAEAAKPRRNSKTVRQEKRETSKKIARTRSQISANTAEVSRQLADLQRIEGDIKISDENIALLSRSVDSIRTCTRILTDSVNVTQARVDALKSSYAASLRAIRSQRQAASATAFIFSSRSFTEARKRVRYLRELSSWEKQKAAVLKDEAERLRGQKERLDSARVRLDARLSVLRKERGKLSAMHSDADALVAKLRRQGRKLEKALSEQQAKAKRLDEELNRIIEQEARRAAEEERKRRAAEEERKRKEAEAAAKAAKSESTTKPAAPAKPAKPAQHKKPSPAAPVASSFDKAKGKLPMPVSGSAVIVSDFGRHAHKNLAKVEIQNNGIDIETTPGSYAVAVYPGVVSMVIVMGGYHNVVLVRHGEYLTVYAGLSDLTVRKGQEVKAGQALGSIYSDPADGNRTRLHFEVRKEIEKLDPAEWLR